MTPRRIETFSDGVLAIIITIMVLELHAPASAEWGALRPALPALLSYLLSFVYLGIYWNNHHHLLHVTRGVTGGIMWANLHLLFWLSLVPFFTAWMGKNEFAAVPTAAYGVVLVLAAIAYWLLQLIILRNEGSDSLLAQAVGRDWKGTASPILYTVAILTTLIHPWIAGAMYALVALMWLIPDRRIERAVRTATK